MQAQYIKLEQLRRNRDRLRQELDTLNALPEMEREACREDRLELASRLNKTFGRPQEYQMPVHRCEQLKELCWR